MAEAEEISSDEFKMLLLSSGEHPDYQSWEGFEKLCRGAISMNERNGYTKDFEDEYISILEAGKPEKLMQKLWEHQLDNYIFSSMAALRLGIGSAVPLVSTIEFDATSISINSAPMSSSGNVKLRNEKCLQVWGNATIWGC